MKKHDDGYVMVLVLVVILVLSIVSAALMSLGVTNMKSQRASIDRMQDKYTAQGMVEQSVARLSQGGKEILLSNVVVSEDEGLTDLVKADLTQWLKETYNVELVDMTVVAEIETETLFEGTPNEEEKDILVCKGFSYKVSGSAQHNGTRIEYGVIISGKLTPSEEDQGDVDVQDTENKTEYSMTVEDVAYTTYQITASSEGGGG